MTDVPRKFVLIGASGYIGSEMIRYLKETLKSGDIVDFSPPDVDLLEPGSIRRISGAVSEATDVICFAGIKKQRGDSLEIHEKNVSMVANLLKYSGVERARSFTFISSAEVYGENVDNMVITEQLSPSPTSFYGIAKLNSELLIAKYFRENSSVAPLLIRPPLVYGPREPASFYGPAGFLNHALANRTITLWGDGEEMRDFMFIDDLVATIYALIRSNCTGTFNLASGKSLSFREIINRIEGLGLAVQVESKPRSREKVDQGYDIAKLKDILPNYMPSSMEGALNKIRAIEENRNKDKVNSGM